MQAENAERRPRRKGGALETTGAVGYISSRIAPAADSAPQRRWTGCPCGCVTRPPWLDDADCARYRRPYSERQLLAWQRAVEHLHAAGLPAAVPELAAASLRRSGERPDWMAAS